MSNFCVPCLECIAQVSKVTPAVNQLQLHIGMPGEDPEGLLSASRQRGIAVQAYSPLGGDQHAALLGSAVVATIARRYNATPAQLCLRWVTQLGCALATSTVNTDYMSEDMDAMYATWSMSAVEMEQLAALDVAPDDPVKSMCLF